jgi:hypothetical protein
VNASSPPTFILANSAQWQTLFTNALLVQSQVPSVLQDSDSHKRALAGA